MLVFFFSLPFLFPPKTVAVTLLRDKSSYRVAVDSAHTNPRGCLPALLHSEGQVPELHPPGCCQRPGEAKSFFSERDLHKSGLGSSLYFLLQGSLDWETLPDPFPSSNWSQKMGSSPVTNTGQKWLAFGPKCLTAKGPDFPGLTPGVPQATVGEPGRTVNL